MEYLTVGSSGNLRSLVNSSFRHLRTPTQPSLAACSFEQDDGGA